MKVYFKYLDNIDLKYTLIPLKSIESSTTFSKKELIAFLEMNKIDVSNSNCVRYFDKERYGWFQITDDMALPVKSKIMLVNKNYYFVSKTIPNINSYLSDQTKQINSIVSQYNSSTNSKETFTLNQKQHKNILILTSSPLIDFYNPTDFEGDIYSIVDILKENDKIPIVKYDILTLDLLSSLITEESPPDIIQMFCMSAYDEDGEIYLAFEDKKGNLIKGNENNLKELSSLHSFFIVITPHSEDVSILFNKIHIRNYLIIHSNLVNDNQMRVFIQKMYKYLLTGEKISNAYSIAINFVNASFNRSMEYHCCCFHSHTAKCLWKKYASNGNNMKAHNLHMCYGCLCDNKVRHVHKELVCKWVKTLNTKIIKKAKFNKNSFPLSNSDKKTFCCCAPEKNHTDIIITFFHVENDTAIFNCIPNNNGNSNITKFYDLKYTSLFLNFLNNNVNLSTSVHGRNKDLAELMNNIDKYSVFVYYGEKGIGKTEYLKFASGYLYERRYIEDVVIINEDKFDKVDHIKNQIKNHIECYANIESNQSVNIDEMIENLLYDRPILVLLKCHTDSIPNNIITLIEEILTIYTKIKFIIIIDSTNPPQVSFPSDVRAVIKELKAISIEDRLNYINELEPEFLYLTGNEKRDKINPESELYKLLDISKGKFNRLNLIIKTYKGRNKMKELLISDIIKVIEETEDDFIDISSIQNEPKKIAIIYLFLYCQQGWSFPDLKILYGSEFDKIHELLSQMYPIIIKREKDNVTLYQIQDNIKEELLKKIKVLPSIKISIKKLLIIKSSTLFRSLLNNIKPSLFDFNALIHFGIWSPVIETDQQSIIPYNSPRYINYINNFIARALSLKSLNHFEYDGTNLLEDSIKDLSLIIPTYLYLTNNIQSLSVIKSFISIFEYYSNYEMKGKMYLLYAFIHSNTGIVDSVDNYPYEEKYINEALSNFENCNNINAVGECYLFSGVIKYKYFYKKKSTSNNYMKDIGIAESMFKSKSTLDYVRVIYMKCLILLKEDSMSEEDKKEMINAYSICIKENVNCYYDDFVGKFIVIICEMYLKIGLIDQCLDFYKANIEIINRIIVSEEENSQLEKIYGKVTNRLLKKTKKDLQSIIEKIKSISESHFK